jgi:hypothetical protein
MKNVIIDIAIILVLLLTFSINGVKYRVAVRDSYNAKVTEYVEQLEKDLGVEIEAQYKGKK